jgi:hypothetical protein
MNDERDLLIEQALTAHRPADSDGGLRFHPAFHDLDDAGRRALFDALQRQRAIERALASDGLSATAHAVLRRIRGSPRA